jgi:hypothetical protein
MSVAQFYMRVREMRKLFIAVKFARSFWRDFFGPYNKDEKVTHENVFLTKKSTKC